MNLGMFLDGSRAIRTVAVADVAAGGAIGTAAATVDNYDLAIISQTTETQLLSNPAPSDTSRYKTFRWYNAGSVPIWNAYGQFIPVGGFADQVYIPGAGWKGVGTNVPQVLYISGAAVTFPADTSENNTPFVTIPGGFIGANSIIETRWLVDNTSGTSNKGLKLKFGAMAPYVGWSQLASATSCHGLSRSVYMTNSTSAQISMNPGNPPDTGGNAAAAVTGTVDTASDVLIQCSLTKGTGGDVTTLRYARVTYMHGA